MNENTKVEVDKIFENLSPKPMPQGLKVRILHKAYEKNRKMKIFSPMFKVLLTASCILIIFVFASDLMIREIENRRLPPTANYDRDLWNVTIDLLNTGSDLDQNPWLTRYSLNRRKKVILPYRQNWMDILKGAINEP